MAEVIKIVLTGGPCGGKTTALNFLKDELEKLANICIKHNIIIQKRKIMKLRKLALCLRTLLKGLPF